MLIYKNTLKKIGKSLGRFISLMLIVLVGVGFYAGIEVTAPNIRNVAYKSYEKNKLFDFKLVNTLGFTDDDVQTLKTVDGISDAYGEISTDVIVNDQVVRFHQLTNKVNTLTLLSGRIPSDANEVIGDRQFYKLGDQIEISGEHELLNQTHFVVVGLADSVLYIGEDYGTSTLGNGKLNNFVFAKTEVFDSPFYTEIYLTINDSFKLLHEGNYVESIQAIEKNLIALRPSLINNRYEAIQAEGLEEIDEQQAVLVKERNDAINKFENAKSELDRNQQQLNNAFSEVQKQQNELNQLTHDKRKEFENAQRTIDQNRYQLDQSLAEQDLSRETLSVAIVSLQNNLSTLNNQLAQLESDTEAFNQLLEQIETLNVQLAGLKQISNAYTKLDQSQTQLTNGIQTFNDGIANGQSKINSALTELRENQYKLNDAYVKYRNQYASFETKIRDAQAKIDETRQNLETLEKPSIHVFTRETTGSYKELDSSIDVISSIARVFPIFFILIAMLMTSNSMSRMIAEERSEIGTLTSMGYSNIQIISTYIAYSIVVTIVGVFIGFYAGTFGIPPLIFGTFSKFRLPTMEYLINTKVLIASLIISAILMTSVSFNACYKALNTPPATLLRPLPPKNGKTIILQRIPSLWKRLSFNWKVTLRNVFRYRKRALMTIIGVAGCTALLVVGFGIRDSMNGIENEQYGEIFKYDTMITLNQSMFEPSKDLLETLSTYNIHEPLLIGQESVTLINNESLATAYLIVPADDMRFSDYYGLEDNLTHKSLDLENGVIVSEKILSLLGVKVGDSITLRDGDYKEVSVVISASASNYISNFIYISSDNYNDVFGSFPNYRTLVFNHQLETTDSLDKDLIDKHDVVNITHSDSLAQSVRDTNDALDSVVVLIVGIASMLALVVLYNLTSINISERSREIATLKVLGFYDNEANSYIYREAGMLTLISIIVGLIAGTILHRYVVVKVEGTSLVFFKIISMQSYIYATLITFALSVLMQVITYWVIQRINMIEALKSVE